jgi:hypothetical protein
LWTGFRPGQAQSNPVKPSQTKNINFDRTTRTTFFPPSGTGSNIQPTYCSMNSSGLLTLQLGSFCSSSSRLMFVVQTSELRTQCSNSSLNHHNNNRNPPGYRLLSGRCFSNFNLFLLGPRMSNRSIQNCPMWKLEMTGNSNLLSRSPATAAASHPGRRALNGGSRECAKLLNFAPLQNQTRNDLANRFPY